MNCVFKNIFKVALFGFRSTYVIPYLWLVFGVSAFFIIFELVFRVNLLSYPVRPDKICFGLNPLYFILVLFSYQIFFGIDSTSNRSETVRFMGASEFARFLPISVREWFWGRALELLMRLSLVFVLMISMQAMTISFNISTRDYGVDIVEKFHQTIAGSAYQANDPAVLELGPLTSVWLSFIVIYFFYVYFMTLELCWILKNYKSRCSYLSTQFLITLFIFILPMVAVNLVQTKIFSGPWGVEAFLWFYPYRYLIPLVLCLLLVLFLRYLDRRVKEGEEF